MFEKLQGVVARFEEIESRLTRPDLDSQELTGLIRERGRIVEVVEVYRRYQQLLADREAAHEMMADSDPDAREMAREELGVLEPAITAAEEELQILTLPRDPNDDKNVILEIRAGTGGDEAGLFTGDLLRMYTRFAEKCGWKTEVLSTTESPAGGFKEVSLLISGEKVYSRLKFEMGAHRVQRVPQTETQGRIHTSACTVAVLPEAEDVGEVDINPSDLQISTTRSSGAGGQHVNTTDSAIRIVHVPSGIVVECQAERSQHKNKDRAMKVLRARLLEKAVQEQNDAISSDRKEQVGSGDRSERIRTYNFPQGRVTDHRINMTLYKLDGFMEGDLGEILDGLARDHQTRLLQQELTQETP